MRPVKTMAGGNRKTKRGTALALAIAIIIAVSAMMMTMMTGCRRHAPEAASAGRIRRAVALCLLDGEEYRTREYVLRALSAVRTSEHQSLVVTPFLPFLSFTEGREAADLADFAAVAREKKTHLVLSLAEQDRNGRLRHTALLFDPSGKIAGRYRKSHRIDQDPNFVPGDELPVFDTAFGRIGVVLTSDFYYPEVFEVLRLQGAEVLVWADYPERFREHSAWPALLYARAVDSHAFLVTAHYADPRTYIADNYTYGMKGAAFGRSMVIDRSGTPRADTGYRDGAAELVFDLDERKVDVYTITHNYENTFYVPNNGGRAAFAPIAAPWTKPALPAFAKRRARIAVAFAEGETMWQDGAYPDVIMGLLDQAAELRPDLVLFSEQNVRKPDDPEVKRGLEAIARWAARHKTYVAVGGLGDAACPNGALRVWDRSGKVVYIEPIYWMTGFPDLAVFDTDFARVGAHVCGDLFQFPIDRVLALKGAELILDPSQMWGPSGYHNDLLLRARAADNGVYLACAHWNTSDPGLRSVVVDPYGAVLAGSAFQRRGVIAADLDFSDDKVFYSGLREDQPKPETVDIPAYFTPDMPRQLKGWRDMIFAHRRPELYGVIPTENEVTRRTAGKRLQKPK
jgi:predicted amidohydrolase